MPANGASIFAAASLLYGEHDVLVGVSVTTICEWPICSCMRTHVREIGRKDATLIMGGRAVSDRATGPVRHCSVYLPVGERVHGDKSHGETIPQDWTHAREVSDLRLSSPSRGWLRGGFRARPVARDSAPLRCGKVLRSFCQSARNQTRSYSCDLPVGLRGPEGCILLRMSRRAASQSRTVTRRHHKVWKIGATARAF